MVTRDVNHSGVPPTAIYQFDETVGPRLYEQMDYAVLLEAKTGETVSVQQRDPALLAGFQRLDGGRIVQGVLNFRQQVGLTEFTIVVGSEPEFDLQVEVFPTKLDYDSDYDELVADVQAVLTGLVLEYLRSTFNLGTAEPVATTTQVEWLTLLSHVARDLEKALNQIARQPHRTLQTYCDDIRAERIKRSDAAVRRSIQRGKGTGRLIPLSDELRIRQQVSARRARPTLDTPEHRWLSAQLTLIRRNLARLRLEETARPTSPRRGQVIREIAALDERIDRVSRLEPITEARGLPPAGFTSLQLIGAPGYQEAYRACLILRLGLRLTGGPLRLTVKDLDALYEYWCFLVLLRTISEETGKPIPARDLLSVRHQGLHVELHRGHEQTVHFDVPGNRRLRIRYNPQFQGSAYLIPQRPDVVLTLNDPAWPPVHLILDAKYRLDGSDSYLSQYGAPGPPDDALNVLHRYRDAILELDHSTAPTARPKRAVVQAVAAFPYRETEPGGFRGSRLWQTLERLGVGAIPLLPGNVDYLREWLRTPLRQGGWAVADGVISHGSADRATEWREAAAQPVLIGVLHPGREVEHLDWMIRERVYYKPLAKNQPRQYAARAIAVYMPTNGRKPGSVSYWGEVEALDVVQRADIDTPWPMRRNRDELQVVYKLREVALLPRAIENVRRSGRSGRISGHRWTSKLALRRAGIMDELFLETEPEWRLYEDLRSSAVPFHVTAGRPTLLDAEEPRGRAWFLLPEGRVQYRGAAGFLFRSHAGMQEYYARPGDVTERMRTSVERTGRASG